MGTPYLYEVPGATAIAQVIDAPGGARRPEPQGEPQVDGGFGKDGNGWEGEGISEEIGFFEFGLGWKHHLTTFSVFSLLGYICWGDHYFFSVISSVSAWSLFAGHATADR